MQGLRVLSDRCDCLVFENDYWAIILSWNSSGLIVMSPEVDLLVSRNSLINAHFYSVNHTLITDWSWQPNEPMHKPNDIQRQMIPDVITVDSFFSRFSPVYSAICRCLFNDFVFLCWTISSFFVERFRRSLLNDFFAVCSTISLLIEWFLSFSPQIDD